jgi:hypothetical protein
MTPEQFERMMTQLQRLLTLQENIIQNLAAIRRILEQR